MDRAHTESFAETIASREDAVRLLERHVVQRGRPVGIFANNNLTARYLCEATHVVKVSIPRELAILSFDDFDLADTLTPPMSVVQQPIEELGRAAARLLFEQIPSWSDRPKDLRPEAIELAPRLVIRESCGCHPGASRERAAGAS